MFSQVVPWRRVKRILEISANYLLFAPRLQADVSISLVLSFFAMLHRRMRVVVRETYGVFFQLYKLWL